MKRLHLLLLILMVLMAFTFLAPGAFDARSRLRKNVLLVTVDSLRADRLGCYGYKRGLTPNMDRLARQGVRFERAISQASWTWPSLHSIMTSTYVSTHGAWFWNLDSPATLVTLPSLLKKKGYACGMVTSHGGLVVPGTLTRDMDAARLVKPQETVPAAVEMLGRFQKTPFFMWVHMMEPHSSRIEFDGPRYLGRDRYPERYNRAVAQADRGLGVILQALEELGLYENTMIIVTADHGENLGSAEVAFAGHGTFLFDELIRVPLIITHGGGLPEGMSVSGQVEHVDIAPTVCDLLQANPSTSFEGKSFVPVMAGEGLGRGLTFSENVEYPVSSSQANPRREDWTDVKSCVRTSEWKLVKTQDPKGKVELELYNLVADPREQVNLVDRETEQAAYLTTILDGWNARSRAAPAGPVRQLDEKHKQQLRNLHYVL